MTTPAIGVNQVTSEELAHDGARDALRAVGTDHIKDGAVSPAKLQPGVPYPFTPGDGSVRSPTIAVADNSGSQDPTTGVGVKSPHIQNGAITLPKLDPRVQPALPKAWCRGQRSNLLDHISSFGFTPGFTPVGQPQPALYTIQWNTSVLGFGERPFLLYAYNLNPALGARALVIVTLKSWVTLSGPVTGINIQVADIAGRQRPGGLRRKRHLLLSEVKVPMDMVRVFFADDGTLAAVETRPDQEYTEQSVADQFRSFGAR